MSRGSSLPAGSLVGLLLLSGGGCGPADPPAPPYDAEGHRAEVEAWRDRRDASLRADDGWLTLVGLFPVTEGRHELGSGPDNDLVFPAGPEHVGTIERADGGVTFTAAPDIAVTADGEPIETGSIASDADGEPTRLEVGSLSFYLIQRHDLLALRLKDSASPVLASFDGLDYYPIDPAWRLEARFEAHDEETTIAVPDVFGNVNESASPGRVELEVDGEVHRIDAMEGANGRLFLVFGDETNGHGTYGGGRFVYTEPPKDGRVIVDFNQSYSPPCVFTPFATCPLPPPQNRLALGIEAGEKTWSGH